MTMAQREYRAMPKKELSSLDQQLIKNTAPEIPRNRNSSALVDDLTLTKHTMTHPQNTCT